MSKSEPCRIGEMGERTQGPAFRYAYQVRFVGNGGTSFGEWVRPYKSKADAIEAARRADSTGLRYGTFVRRVRLSKPEYEDAR